MGQALSVGDFIIHKEFVILARQHKTLRCSPAMAAGLTGRLWDMKDIVALVEAAEAAMPPKVRGPYKKRAA